MEAKTLFVEINKSQVRMAHITEKGITIQWIDGTVDSAKFEDELNPGYALHLAAQFSIPHATILAEQQNVPS